MVEISETLKGKQDPFGLLFYCGGVGGRKLQGSLDVGNSDGGEG